VICDNYIKKMDKYNVRLGKDKDIKQRKNLNADALIGLIRSSFKNLKDHRSEKAQIPLADAFMSLLQCFRSKSLLYSLLRRGYQMQT
jgi:hypothetical protein